MNRSEYAANVALSDRSQHTIAMLNARYRVKKLRMEAEKKSFLRIVKGLFFG